MRNAFLAAAALLLGLSCAYAGDFSGYGFREAIDASRSGDASGIPAAGVSQEMYEKSRDAAPPKDDLKAPVLRHLQRMEQYCDEHMDDCNGRDGSIREFAMGIGGGRCHNRGFNCVWEVLGMCKDQAEDGEVTPMYWMACGAMLGKLGERDCAEGRATCGGDLQASLYFGLRAAAGCRKSYEKDQANLALTDKNIERFAKVVKQNVRDVYVGEVEEGQSVGHHLAWFAVHKAGMISTEKVLEFAFERLAWHTAGAVVSSASVPLFAFTGAMLFHEIAASEMNRQVCTQWSHSYKGSYANVAGSVTGMTSRIR